MSEYIFLDDYAMGFPDGRSRGVPNVDEEGNLTAPDPATEIIIDEEGEYKIKTDKETGIQEVTTFDEETKSKVITRIKNGEVIDVEYKPIIKMTDTEKLVATAVNYDKTSETVKNLLSFAPLGGLGLLALLI